MTNQFRVWCKNKNEWEKDELALLSTGDLWDVNRNAIVRKDTHIVEFAIGVLDKHNNMIHEGDKIKLYEIEDSGELKENILEIMRMEDTMEIVAWHSFKTPCDGTGYYMNISEMVIVNGSPQRDVEIVGHIHEGDK